MGLDSVDILVRVEKYFGVSIQNKEAESIRTVQEFADCVFTKVNLNPNEKCKSQMLFYKLRTYFINESGFNKEDIQLDSKINTLITGNPKETWKGIEEYLKLRLPPLSVLDVNPSKEKEIKILGIKVWDRKSPVTTGTVGDLVNWTLAENHNTLISTNALFEKGDVEKVIVGIISDAMGIPVHEIKLEHRITDDLGVD